MKNDTNPKFEEIPKILANAWSHDDKIDFEEYIYWWYKATPYETKTGQ